MNLNKMVNETHNSGEGVYRSGLAWGWATGGDTSKGTSAQYALCTGHIGGDRWPPPGGRGWHEGEG